MQLYLMELDRDSRFLIWFNIFLLISLISTGIIYEFFQDYITVQNAIVVGLLIGVGAVLKTALFLKKRKEKMQN